jgi:hypothetical protein
MPATNTVLRTVTLPALGFAVMDDLILLSSTSQGTAQPVLGECSRVTSAPLNGALILREGDAGSAAPLTFVVNDSSQSIKVFAAAGENLNGTLNGSLSIPASQAGYFVRVPRAAGASTPDWRAGTIS